MNREECVTKNCQDKMFSFCFQCCCSVPIPETPDYISDTEADKSIGRQKLEKSVTQEFLVRALVVDGGQLGPKLRTLLACFEPRLVVLVVLLFVLVG